MANGHLDMGMRAYDKVREARFFIDRLARTKGRLPRARYYASAAIMSLRSATWILQADLRPRFGTRFELWWAERRALLEHAGIGFVELRDLRNLIEKQGRPAVARLIRREYPDGPVSALEFLSHSTDAPGPGFRIEFRAGQHTTLFESSFTEEEAEVAASAIIDEAIDLRDKLLAFRLPELGPSAPVFGTDLDLPFVDAVRGLREYAAVLESILQGAERELVT